MISVCMTTFNGERFLKEQIDSILLQLNPHDELIISDDSSDDNTIEIIKSYNDSRIRLLENNHFNSPVFNMENALKHAGGNIIFLADQDDVWLPGKVQRVTDSLQDNDLVITNAIIINDKGETVHDSYFKWKGSTPGFWKNLKKNSYLGCAIAFNKKILHAALPFPESIIMHDVWIGLLAERIGKIKFLDEKLMLYRRHNDNFTASINLEDNNLSDFSLGHKLNYRRILLDQIVKRVWTLKFLTNREN